MKKYFILFIALIFILNNCKKGEEKEDPFNPSNIDPSEWAPSNLQIEQLSVSSVKLTWEDNCSFEDGFKIDRKIGNENWEKEIGTIKVDSCSWIDNNINLDMTLSYKVYAYSNEYYSEYAEQSINTSLQKPTNLIISQTSNNEIQLLWTDNSIAETGFRIDRKIEGEDWINSYSTVNKNVTVLYDDIEQIYKNYSYRVCAYNDSHLSLFTESKIYIGFNFISVDSLIIDHNYNLSVNSNSAFLSWYEYAVGAGLYAINISNPNNINVINELNIISGGINCIKKDNYLFVTCYGSMGSDCNYALIVFDITNINNPIRVNEFYNDDYPNWRNICYNDNNIFVIEKGAYSWSDNNLLIFENEYNLIKKLEDCFGDPKEVLFSNNQLFIADGEYGLKIVDIQNINNPFIIGSCDTDGNSKNIIIKDNFVFMSDGENGLTVVDINNQSNPYIISTYTETGVYDIAIDNNIAYIIDKENMIALDVSDILNIKTINSIYFGENLKNIKIVGDYALINNDFGLISIKIKP